MIGYLFSSILLVGARKFILSQHIKLSYILIFWFSASVLILTARCGYPIRTVHAEPGLPDPVRQERYPGEALLHAQGLRSADARLRSYEFTPMMSTQRSASPESVPIGQTWQGSFSAVSKPNFASKNAFESSRRDLRNALLCAALQSQFFVKILPEKLL